MVATGTDVLENDFEWAAVALATRRYRRARAVDAGLAVGGKDLVPLVVEQIIIIVESVAS
ncbi:MAG: hypothetical protein ACI8P2_004353 [Candidatus Latescibacterota bacterium]